jgi:asparagine synthase (glutamine-hydrolysing)
MCGIAGAMNRSEQTPDEVARRQLETMLHRGPDSLGWSHHGRATVGQTRLAVIDLVTGDPPITSAEGTIGAALNGEIYNFRDLRSDLSAAGAHFVTRGDTEVLVHLTAAVQDPVALARRLDGMFAAAVWDGPNDRLILIRDRAGKKPLYYWAGDQSFVFGSEIKAVLAHPDVPCEMATDVIPAYLGFGYVPSPRTFYEGIYSVPPGHVLTVDSNLAVTVEPYWEMPLLGVGANSRLVTSLDEAAELVERELTTAVKRRMVADVPLGAFLSGGIDSSAVVALMAETSSTAIRTFTIGFEGTDGYDERPYARMVADRYETDHVEFVVRPSAVDLVDELVWHHDQPFGDSSAVPTYLLSQLTKQHVTVALCGDGGDELFAGYERFAAALAAEKLSRLPRAARGALSLGAGPLRRSGLPGSAKAARFLEAASGGLPHALRSWVSYMPDRLVSDLVGNTSAWALADYQGRWSSTAGADPLDRILHLNFETYLLDDLLPKVDRMSMAHGLEVRAPFLDHHLVEIAMRLPPSTKLLGTNMKRVLKRAMESRLPKEILHRPKRGFGIPLDRWFREDLAVYVDGMLADPHARVRRHVSPEALDRILAEHRSGLHPHGHALWTLLTLEVFLRRRDW